MTLFIRPLTLREANAYVAAHHRHNKPVVGHRYSIGCFDGERMCGVAIVGHPVARRLDDGLTVEIYRVCTDGTYNACSMLYGACARIAREMGYKRSGFTNYGEAGGTDWNCASRPRETTQFTLFGEERKYPDEKKIRWEKRFK